MSTTPKTIDDPEKGIEIQDIALPSFPESATTTVRSSYVDLAKKPVDEEKKTIEVSTAVVPAKKDSSAPAKKAKPKSKVSRWIRFQLWFNTYR